MPGIEGKEWSDSAHWSDATGNDFSERQRGQNQVKIRAWGGEGGNESFCSPKAADGQGCLLPAYIKISINRERGNGPKEDKVL